MVRTILDGVEALAALERHGTVSEAASSLRLTQSAVSKRLRALKEAVRYPVVEPDGRRVRLTASGLELLSRARPVLAALRELAGPAENESDVTFSLALADSVAASWGPAVVADALRRLPGVAVELHAHRSVLLIERVRLGRYQLGLATDGPTPPDLLRFPIFAEPLVLAAGAGPQRGPVITIEPGSATWGAVEPALRRHHPDLVSRPRIGVESFSAAVQMARAGFGDALVPLGLAMDAGLSWTEVAGVSRPISLVTRKTVHHLPAFVRLESELRAATARWFESR